MDLPIQALGRFSHLHPCTLSFPPQNFRSPPPSFAVTSLFPLPARRFSHLRLCALSSLFLPKLPLTAPIVPSLPYFHFPPAAFSSVSLCSLVSRSSQNFRSPPHRSVTSLFPLPARRFFPLRPCALSSLVSSQNSRSPSPSFAVTSLFPPSRSPLFPLRPCALSSLFLPKLPLHRPHRSVTSLFPLPARRFFLSVSLCSLVSRSSQNFRSPPPSFAVTSLFPLPAGYLDLPFPFFPTFRPLILPHATFFLCLSSSLSTAVGLPSPMCAAERRKRLREDAAGWWSFGG